MNQVLCSITLFKEVKKGHKGQEEKGISTPPGSLGTHQEIKKLIKEASILVSGRKKIIIC